MTISFSEGCDARHANGREAMLGKQPLVPFSGIKDDTKEMLLVAAQFGKNSDQRLREMLCRIEAETGIRLFMAVRDYPLHCTIVLTKGGLDAGSSIQQCVSTLVPKTLIFTRAVLTPTGEILLMGPVTAELDRARTEIHALAAAVGGEGNKLPIMHMTASRLLVGGEVSSAARERFVALVEELNASMSSAPSELRVDRLFVGSCYDLLTHIDG